MTTATLLTTADVVNATSISYRQLDYWTKRGLLTTVGTGHFRLYSPDVVEVIEDLLARIDACPFDHAAGRRPRR